MFHLVSCVRLLLLFHIPHEILYLLFSRKAYYQGMAPPVLQSLLMEQGKLAVFVPLDRLLNLLLHFSHGNWVENTQF